MSTEYITEPGTEENLRLLMDPHPFDPAQQDMSPPIRPSWMAFEPVASIGSTAATATASSSRWNRTTPNSVVSLRPSTTGIEEPPVSSLGAQRSVLHHRENHSAAGDVPVCQWMAEATQTGLDNRSRDLRTMPEGPEIRRAADRIGKALVGKVVEGRKLAVSNAAASRFVDSRP